jgi:C4-dicarboxylate transporter, DctM subunit
MIAGIIPGILTALAYCGVTYGMVRLWPALAPQRREREPLRDRMRATLGIWPILILFVVIMGGIYGGLFSPSAAGAVGAFAALVIVLLRRRLTWSGLLASLRSSVETTAMLFIIIIAGLIYSRMLVFSGLVQDMVGFVTSLELRPVALLLILSVVYVVLGCVMDGISMLLVTMPFVFPVVVAVGIDPILFGILVIVYIEIGAITPPIGLTLFATVSAARGNLRIEDVMRFIVPFIVVNILLIGMFIAFPQIVLWAPQNMRF